MQLNITNVQKLDYGEYQCVSKNEANTTTAVIYVNGMLTRSPHILKVFNYVVSE